MTIFRHRHFVTLAVVTYRLNCLRAPKSPYFNELHNSCTRVPSLACAVHYHRAWRRKSQATLKISINERAKDAQIKLDGRIAGPWTAELRRVWVETAPRISGKRLVIDLREVTYADASATKLLQDIYIQTHAQVIAGSVWTQSLAEYITQSETHTHREGK